MGNQDEIEGFIAYFGLKEWWLSSFSKDERNISIVNLNLWD